MAEPEKAKASVDHTPERERDDRVALERPSLLERSNLHVGSGTLDRLAFEGLRAHVQQQFGSRGLGWEFALCVWRNEGEVVGYAVSATNDHGPWQLHGARWPGDAGLLEVFYSWGYTDPYDVGQSTEFTAGYVAENGWGPWVGARYC